MFWKDRRFPFRVPEWNYYRGNDLANWAANTFHRFSKIRDKVKKLQTLEKRKTMAELGAEEGSHRKMVRGRSLVYSYIMSDRRRYGTTFLPGCLEADWHVGDQGNSPWASLEKGIDTVAFANVTAIIDNLEKLNYARSLSDPAGRRLARVELTGAGSVLLQENFPGTETVGCKTHEWELRGMIKYTEPKIPRPPDIASKSSEKT